MPMAIPLIAAAGSIAAGMAATSAIVGGLLIAGGALTAVGAVTGNKKLMKIGSIVSLVGGVAGLATSAWQAASTELAASAAETGAAGAGELANAGAGVGETLGEVANTAGTAGEAAASGVVDAAGSAAGGAAESGGLIADGAGFGTENALIDPVQTYSAGGNYDALGSLSDAPTSSIQSVGETVADAGSVAAPSAPVADLTNVSAPAAPTVSAPDPYAQYQSSMQDAGLRNLADTSQTPTTNTTFNDVYNGVKSTAGGAMDWMNKNPSGALLAGQMIQGAAQGYAQSNMQDKQLQALEDRRKQINNSILAVKMFKAGYPK